MQCSTPLEPSDYDEVCEHPPSAPSAGEVYINALHDKMPDCDRPMGAVQLDELESAKRCLVRAMPHKTLCANIGTSCGASATE